MNNEDDPIELDLVKIIYDGNTEKPQYWALNDDDFDNTVNTEAGLSYAINEELRNYMRVELISKVKIPAKYFGPDSKPYIA
jgi:hypothetical protein